MGRSGNAPAACGRRPALPGRSARRPRTAKARSGRRSEKRRPETSASEPARVREARDLIARTERNPRSDGKSFEKADLRAFAPRGPRAPPHLHRPADHTHRIGLERSRFEELGGPERERAAEQIEKARRRDARRLEVASEEGPEHPVRERPRLALERIRQLGEGASPERREHLRALRRERRAATISGDVGTSAEAPDLRRIVFAAPRRRRSVGALLWGLTGTIGAPGRSRAVRGAAPAPDAGAGPDRSPDGGPTLSLRLPRRRGRRRQRRVRTAIRADAVGALARELLRRPASLATRLPPARLGALELHRLPGRPGLLLVSGTARRPSGPEPFAFLFARRGGRWLAVAPAE